MNLSNMLIQDFILNEKEEDLINVLSKEERQLKENELIKSGCVPACGYEFKSGQLRKAGDYLLGPILGSSPVKSMLQCLGRKIGTDNFYTLKILTVRENEGETQDDRQGKMLLHTEHSLLSFLDGQPGILKQHGLFQDYVCDADSNLDERTLIGNGKLVRRISLILDCLYPHEYNRTSSNYINLQHYVIGKRKLIELDAFTIFYNIVSVVNRLHELNVIHRDIKLANLVLNQRTRQVTLINFCLGQHLVSENDRLQDQRGSPAYISPDVLMGKPYLGKPSDMWALGVLLFTMLFGQFPFYHKFHQELFKMIKTASYTFPSDSGVKSDTLDIIRGLLLLDPNKRLTAHQVLVKLSSIITARLSPDNNPSYDAQIVPNLELIEEEYGVKTNDQSQAKKLPKKSKTEGDGNALNDLDYFINRTPPETPLDKKVATYPTISSILMKNLPPNVSACEGTRSSNTISVNEGDIRSFTHVDLYLHRNLFPRYSGPDLIRWRSSKERAAPIPCHTGNPPPLGRAAARVPQSNSIRMATNGAPSSSMDIPPLNSTQNMYEFPPARRWALAILQQLKDSPDDKPPAVPQMVPGLSIDDAVPTTSKTIVPVTVINDPVVSTGQACKPNTDSCTSSQISVAGSSGVVSKKCMETDARNQNLKSAKVAKLSKMPSKSSSLAVRRMKTKNLGKLSRSPLFLKLCSTAKSRNSSVHTVVDSNSSDSASTSEFTSMEVDNYTCKSSSSSNTNNYGILNANFNATDVQEAVTVVDSLDNSSQNAISNSIPSNPYANSESLSNDEINPSVDESMHDDVNL